MLIKRLLQPILADQARQYPVVSITGPRQSGKTTLARQTFPEKTYFSLENPADRRRALSDPTAFLNAGEKGMIIDEIQRAPELLSYIQGIVDEKNEPGMFILTGSSQFEMMASVSQSLAGRTAVLKLLPFVLEEAYPDARIPPAEEILFRGFYPRIFDKGLNPTEALSYYFNTYVERDIRNLLNVKDLGLFENFVKLSAGRTAQLINTHSIGSDCGVAHNTVRNWISLLEASYILFKLQPHHANFGKRLVKTPKVFFIDTGLAAYLLDIETPSQLTNHPLKGNLFENMVISEFYKMRLNANRRPNLYFWRDNVGHEIDLLLDFGTAVLPVEIKAGKTVSRDYFKGLDFYRSQNPECLKGLIIYGGEKSFRERDTSIISYKDLGLLKNLNHELRLP